jgi:hypothetical protein
VTIYNDGLKNMVESADSMKRDARKMNLSCTVNSFFKCRIFPAL